MVTVIFTCYNRLEKTKNCIESITKGNPSLEFAFVVLDDGSTDGTVEMLEALQREGLSIRLLFGDGTSFWAGGMKKAIAAAKKAEGNAYYLLVNDDVDFTPHAVEQLIAEYEKACTGNSGAALVGATCDAAGKFTYGGIRYDRGIHYHEVTPEQKDRECDTFNMNCLLLDEKTFRAVPGFDAHYVHSLADLDYGLTMKRMGIAVQTAPFYVGICEKNDPAGSWLDRSLPRRERLRRKEAPKGAPFRPWFYFLYKNFGLRQALLHGFTPFVRILSGK
jgi:GT2 family glycosyltransferase